MTDVARLLEAATRGDRQGAAQLLLVYDEHHTLAASRLVNEKPGQPLELTAIVHESLLQFVRGEQFDTRGAWFTFPFGRPCGAWRR